MNAELIDVSEVKKRFEIEIPEDIVTAEVTIIAREFGKRAKVPGFRPGKAPLGVVKNRYKDDILSELYQHLLPRYFSEAVEEKELQVVESSTTFEPPEYATGEPLKFEVGFEIFPVFEICDYSEIPVEEAATEVTEEEIDEYFKQTLEEHSEMLTVEEERPLASGDFAEISFSGSLVGADSDDDKEGEEMSGEKALCELCGETTVKEFTENLTGAGVGDEVDFEVVYREDHPEERLAGKTAKYHVKIEGIKEKIRPELDDEFAQSLGDYKTIADLRVEVRKNMEEHRTGHAQQQMRDGLLSWLEDNNEFEVPDSLVDQQLQTRLQRLMRNLTQQGMNPKSLDIDWGKIRSDQYGQAVRDVRGLLLLEHLAEKENITVSDEEIEAEIQTMAAEMQQSPASVRDALARNDGLERMNGQIRNNKTLELLQSKAKIVPAGSLTAKADEPDGPEDDGPTIELAP